VASIAYRNEEQLLNGPDWEGRYLEMIMPEKLRQELEYVDRRSFWTDFGVIIRTITALFR
jgi:lipopolysaccharide/colanic/teichoic acid biosynthesis glycosyltransferase